jgi:hypothetical protein
LEECRESTYHALSSRYDPRTSKCCSFSCLFVCLFFPEAVVMK